MDLRGLGHTIRHRAPTETLSSNRSRDNHHAALRIRFESGHSSFDVLLRTHDVGHPALRPLVVVHGCQVVEVREARPAGIGDDDVQAAEGGDGVFDALGAVGHGAAIALQDGGFHFVGFFDFGGQVFGGLFVVGVVDGDVGAVGRELAADFCSEASIIMY